MGRSLQRRPFNKIMSLEKHDLCGFTHFTVLVNSDGDAVASGDNDFGQCEIPALEGDESYIQVAAGFIHTVLLRSNGIAFFLSQLHSIDPLMGTRNLMLLLKKLLTKSEIYKEKYRYQTIKSL